MSNFQLAELQRSIEASLDGIQASLLARGEVAYEEKATSLQRQRQELQQRSLLSLAFSGQFNAGKSTIISALTGNTGIRIAADVATDDVQAYRWQDIELWDTPGLYADRPDHTVKAEQALREADLIVYCLTTNLFDAVTSEDFKRLAFVNRYAPKIFLLVNKLSMEDVNDTEVFIANLTCSINNTLAPHQLSEFDHAFIDAQDYRDGVAAGDQALIEFSRFEVFVQRLNRWVKAQGLLARLDPSIRMGLNVIDDVLGSLQDTTFTQNPELFLLNQQIRIVQSQQQRTAGEVRRIGTALQQKVLNLGEQLINGELGTDPRAAEEDFQAHCEEYNREAYDDLNSTLQQGYEQLLSKLDDFAKQPFVAEYFASVDAQSVGQIPHDEESSQGGSNPLLGIAKELLDKGRKNLYKAGVTPKAFLPSAKEVAGGAVHKGIYEVAKIFGKKFKPWEAVRWAKGVGQAVAILGVVFAAYEVYEQVNDGIEAEERQRKADQQLTEIRCDIRNLAEAMVAQLQQVVQQEYELPVLAPILESLNAARDQLLAEEAGNRDLVNCLSTRRSELRDYLEQLYAVEGEAPA
jgi:GTP-binding protein EngB required for normal cell division